MQPGSLYEAPFTDLHAGGPDALFAEKGNVIAGVFGTLERAHAGLEAAATAVGGVR